MTMAYLVNKLHFSCLIFVVFLMLCSCVPTKTASSPSFDYAIRQNIDRNSTLAIICERCQWPDQIKVANKLEVLLLKNLVNAVSLSSEQSRIVLNNINITETAHGSNSEKSLAGSKSTIGVENSIKANYVLNYSSFVNRYGVQDFQAKISNIDSGEIYAVISFDGNADGNWSDEKFFYNKIDEFFKKLFIDGGEKNESTKQSY